MISTENLIALSVLCLLGLALPLVGSIIWKVKTGQLFTTILVGWGMFFGFAIILEIIPKLFLFQIENPVSRAIMSNPILLSIIGGLIAGIFEETGRFVAFKFILRKRKNRLTAITYGIGHGGFEVMYLLGIAGIQNVVLAIMFKTGLMANILANLRTTDPVTATALADTAVALRTVTLDIVGLSIMERVSAVLIHISCSIIMFMAVNGKKKMWLFPVSILVHASIDFFAGLYQVGIINNLVVFEICLLIWGIAMFALCYIFLYQRMPKDWQAQNPQIKV